jgi:protein SCO1/2
MKAITWLALSLSLIGTPTTALAATPYTVNGLVLSVDGPLQKLTVSCQEVPGFMPAKVAEFEVASPNLLNGIARGSLVDITVRVMGQVAYAETIRVHKYDSDEREPSNARRLRALDKALSGPDEILATGQAVPDFELIDQKSRPVRLQQFRGKIVLLNFIYTRCVLPNYCFRLANNFGVVQKRERERLGHDLILVTVTFDPVHDRPDVLFAYAKTWNADPENWRFLTGAESDVQRVCAMFGVNSFPNEGLFVHSMHTAVIGRDGKLIANLEGNRFTAQQLSDLVDATLTSQN